MLFIHYNMASVPSSFELSDTKTSNITKTIVQSALSVSVRADHPKLVRSGSESACRFLNSYDQHAYEVIARARQLGTNVVVLEASRPVGLKFCVDIEYINFTITLGLIHSVSSYEDLTNTVSCT